MENFEKPNELENVPKKEEILGDIKKDNSKKYTKWTEDLAREELTKIYTEWLSDTKEGEVFGPSVISEKKGGLYTWIRKNKIPLESLLPPGALSRLTDRKEIKWTESEARETLAKVYADWIADPNRRDVFGPSLINEKKSGLYKWIAKSKIPIESLLPTEAISKWKPKKEEINWTEDLARQGIAAIYADWLNDSNKTKLFGPIVIKKQNSGLYAWINKNQISIESLLPNEAMDQFARRISWTEDLARQELVKIYSEWKSQAKEDDTFGPNVIQNIRVGLYDWLRRKKVSIESLLPQDALFRYRNQMEQDKDLPDGPEKWISTEKIAENTGLSKEQVDRITAKLRQKHPDKFGKFNNKNKQ